MAAVVADDALRLAGRARRVEDVERVGRVDRARSRPARACEHASSQSRSRPGCELGLEHRPLQDDAALAACASTRSIAASSSGLYATTRPGSMPHEAETTTFGFASSMRLASSFAAKPPKTTEWIGAEPRAREHRDHRLRDHRHVDDDPVAALDALRGERAGEARDRVAQLAVGERRRRAGDRGVVDQRELVGAACARRGGRARCGTC